MCEKQIVHKVFSEVVCHHNLHSIAADNVWLWLFFSLLFCTVWNIFEKTRCITLHFLCCDAPVQTDSLWSQSNTFSSILLVALWPWPPGKPPHHPTLPTPLISAPLGWALCRPVSVSDRVAPHGYLFQLEDRTRRLLRVFNSQLNWKHRPSATPLIPPKTHCQSRTLYLYTATSSLR